VLPIKGNMPQERVPVATLALIAIHIAGYFVLDEGSVLYLLASTLFLWLFGPAVEDRLGRVRFLAIFVAGGLAAGLADRALESDPSVALVGGAGAIAAVQAAHAMLFPRATVLTVVLIPFLMGVVAIPAAVLFVLWIALQVVGLGATGFLAQLAGVAVGLVLGRLLGGARREVEPGVPAY
jgi:membrane associated rhomboid family serine protease